MQVPGLRDVGHGAGEGCGAVGDPAPTLTHRKSRAAEHRVGVKDGGENGLYLPPAELRSDSPVVPMCDGV